MAFSDLLFGKPSESEQKLRDLIKNTYKTARVVGRGTLVVDAKEVRETPEFQAALKRAKKIVCS